MNKENEILNKMIKLKVTDINGYDYTLESINGDRYVKNIEFYGENKPKINNYIYISENIVKEKNLFQYGVINDINNINEKEIIKIVDENKEYFLQRYYG